MKLTPKEFLASLPPQIAHHIQHLERMREDFVANVSHELRTPLTVMHGYLEALLDHHHFDEPWQKIFLQMYQQTLRMENLIENLLLLSRLEGLEIDSKSEHTVIVADILEQIYGEAREISGESKHHILLQADSKLMLRGCDIELRSLFSNIIFNAIKYTPDQGTIEIKWFQENGHAHFSVQDTGIGIAPEHIDRLTERFYRVDPARSRASGGTGLGLAIAKHVVLRHESQLDIQSECNKGSLFTCIFPPSRLIIG